MKRKDLSPEQSFYPPYARDIRNLLLLYYRTKSTSIRDLKVCWKHFGFSRIHLSSDSENNIPYDRFLQEMFITLVGYLVNTNNPIQIRVGALYSLYFLYMTQKVKNQHLIQISDQIFRQLLEFRDLVKRRRIINAYHILLYLVESKCFSFVAKEEYDPNISSIHTPYIHMNYIQSPNLIHGTTNLRSLNEVGSRYYPRRQQIFPSHHQQPNSRSLLDTLPQELAQFSPPPPPPPLEEEAMNRRSSSNNNNPVSNNQQNERISRNRWYQVCVESKIEEKFRKQSNLKKTVGRDFPRRRIPLVVEDRYRSNPSLLGTIIDYLPVKPEPISSSSEEENSNNNNRRRRRRRRRRMNDEDDEDEDEEEEEIVFQQQQQSQQQNNDIEVINLHDDKERSEGDLKHRYSLDIHPMRFLNPKMIQQIQLQNTNNISLNRVEQPKPIEEEEDDEEEVTINNNNSNDNISPESYSIVAGFAYRKCGMKPHKIYIPPSSRKWTLSRIMKSNEETPLLLPPNFNTSSSQQEQQQEQQQEVQNEEVGNSRSQVITPSVQQPQQQEEQEQEQSQQRQQQQQRQQVEDIVEEKDSNERLPLTLIPHILQRKSRRRHEIYHFRPVVKSEIPNQQQQQQTLSSSSSSSSAMNTGEGIIQPPPLPRPLSLGIKREEEERLPFPPRVLPVPLPEEEEEASASLQSSSLDVRSARLLRNPSNIPTPAVQLSQLQAQHHQLQQQQQQQQQQRRQQEQRQQQEQRRQQQEEEEEEHNNQVDANGEEGVRNGDVGNQGESVSVGKKRGIDVIVTSTQEMEERVRKKQKL